MTTAPLNFDRIPIERHWSLSMRLHKALGHTEPWELCEAGCDQLASDAIRILFDVESSAEQAARQHTGLGGLRLPG